MQLGHESSNTLKPIVDQQLIDGVQLHARRSKLRILGLRGWISRSAVNQR